MVQDMAVGERPRQALAAKVLPAEEWGKYLNQSSDVAGSLQLFFHVGCALAAAAVVYYGREHEQLAVLIVGELALGFVSSFYFMGYHELIHNTAFATKCLNTLFSHIVGFWIFRGANWFWCFHWLHHRYTQDPEKDPELSGGSADLLDPSKSVLMYARFMTGWPFGFERTFKMVKMAAGLHVDHWVATAGMENTVRIESAIYALFYGLCIVGAILDARVREVILWYWLLPHMLGAGHLRFYQFAEHRACETGTYTDLDAWGSARTTATWWFYRRLAWNMPFHVEHHAWPAVPFHLLPDVHDRIKDSQPKTRCIINGDAGYLGIHAEFVRRVWKGESTSIHLNSSQAAESAGEKSNRRASLASAFSVTSAAEQLPKFTMKDVASHKTRDDCWVVVDGFVMNVTTFLADHPGGEPILLGKGGQDATKVFHMIHPEGTLNRMLPAHCLIGTIATESDANGLSAPLLPR